MTSDQTDGMLVPVTLDQLIKNNIISEKSIIDLMGRIITQYRDSHKDPDSNFHAASLHQVIAGEGDNRREFLAISNNIDPLDPFNRACAEMRALQEAKGTLKISRDEMHIDRSFLMGQSILEEKKDDEIIKTPVMHERVTPCGHCRDELVAISDDDSQLYIYPAMSHDEFKQRSADMKLFEIEHAAEIPFGVLNSSATEVAKLPIKTLLPSQMIQLQDAKIVGKMKEGVEFVEKDSTNLHLIHVDGENGSVSYADGVEGTKLTARELSEDHGKNYTLENVNKALVNKIKDRFHREGGIHGYVTAAMVRRGDGKCYIASGVEKDPNNPDILVPSQPDSAVEALSKSGAGKDVKEMVVMRMNKDEILSLSDDKAPELKTLKGSTLDRLSKKASFPKQGKTFKDMFGDDIDGRAKIHILPFNDGNIDTQMLKDNMASFRLSQLYPLSFNNPDSQQHSV